MMNSAAWFSSSELSIENWCFVYCFRVFDNRARPLKTRYRSLTMKQTRRVPTTG